MSEPAEPKPVKIFLTILHGAQNPAEPLEDRLAKEFGAIDARTPDFASDSSHYLMDNSALGPTLRMRMISFTELAAPDELPAIKRHVYKIEQHYAGADGVRAFNIGAGWLDPMRVGLATFKDAAHRLYLGQGVFGEIAMIRSADFEGERYRTLPWTYPDFQTAASLAFFEEMLKLYRAQTRSGS